MAISRVTTIDFFFFFSYPNPFGAFENIRYKCVKVAGR